jgi:DNA polymerase III sliding clamp (beta) subunit (PCNA family)
MNNIIIKTKDLLSILKTFSDFANQSLTGNSLVATISSQPEPCIAMMTDHAYVSCPLKNLKDCTFNENFSSYTFNPRPVLDMLLAGNKVTLEWFDANSPLQVTDARLIASLKIATKKPAGGFSTFEKIESIKIPIGILHYAYHQTDIPYAYYSADSNLAPVRFYSKGDGILNVSADDSYSIARAQSKIDVQKTFDVKVPRYVLKSLFSVAPENPNLLVNFAFGVAVGYFENSLVKVMFSTLLDDIVDFDDIYKSQTGWKTSCKFHPREWVTSIKPLMALIPAKDRSGSMINFEATNKIKLSLLHGEIGQATVDNLEGVSGIYNENNAKNVLIRMHPKAFYEYTSLLSCEEALFAATTNVVHYKGSLKHKYKKDSILPALPDMSVEYLFPTVQV